MAYNATKAITEGYYLSGIVARDQETVSGSQLNDGLSALNSLLSMKSITGRFVPYYTVHNFTAVIGQERYFIENLIEFEAFTFELDTSFRFPTTNIRRKRYFGDARANNIRSLPVTRHFERTVGGGYIYLNFKPQSTYPLQLVGKFGFDSVDYETDLSTLYDQFYIDYLTYELARRLCASNAYTLPPQTKEILDEYNAELRDLMAIDLSMEKVSTLQRGSSFNYADANIGRGWRP
jgi:hypothetical protein